MRRTAPADKINDSLTELTEKLRDDQNKMIWIKTASAMMTTDTKPKLAYEEFTIRNKIIKIAGVAKGSGMIAPNLQQCYLLFLQMQIAPNLLRMLLKKITVASTFNAITVDSDQSTNDMVTIFSTKKN